MHEYVAAFRDIDFFLQIILIYIIIYFVNLNTLPHFLQVLFILAVANSKMNL